MNSNCDLVIFAICSLFHSLSPSHPIIFLSLFLSLSSYFCLFRRPSQWLAPGVTALTRMVSSNSTPMMRRTVDVQGGSEPESKIDVDTLEMKDKPRPLRYSRHEVMNVITWRVDFCIFVCCYRMKLGEGMIDKAVSVLQSMKCYITSDILRCLSIFNETWRMLHLCRLRCYY